MLKIKPTAPHAHAHTLDFALLKILIL